MTRPRCIIFDVDDTLYLERDYVCSGFAAVDAWLIDQHAIDGFYNAASSLFEAGVRGTIFNLALRQLDVPDTQKLIAELLHIYRTHEPSIELLPDARRCLDRLVGTFHIAALTGGPVPCQHAKVEVLDLHQWCTPVIYAARWGHQFDKPHPRAYQELERCTGYKGPECIYVCDNPAKDFLSPRRMNWHLARIRRPTGLHFAQTSSPAVAEFSNLDDFITWILAYGAIPRSPGSTNPDDPSHPGIGRR